VSRFLEGKIAVVTGGTRGIGRAIAEALLTEGASVAICGRSQAGVDRAMVELGTSEKRVVGAAVDVSTERGVSQLFRLVDEQFNGLDILVNNAGLGIFRSVAETSPNDWRQILDTNLSGVFYCCHEAVPRLRHRGGGTIINISSLAGKNPFAGGAAYNASKFGLNGFSEALMLDHRYDNIRVSYVMPGSVDTDFGGNRSKASWKMAPQDVADVVLMILRIPARTTISRVEMRPSLPPR
jgi:NAD(P)-dependent dehydrogenase (short-subunit alcohol dehydrogenase family)